ncbi:MAG: type II secretion system protein [Parasporobacterium sp.]|nr:type II secretion system protein [Parasporobacterium sp.]
MLKKIKQKIKDRSGFSLAEVLMVVIIVLLVSSIVAVGVPAAARAYNKVVDAANAQTLLSTTITRLREELGTADNIDTSAKEGATNNTIISYDNSLGVRTQIHLEQVDVDRNIIYIHEYLNFDKANDFNHPLVSDSASGKKLYATYDKVSFENGVVTFEGLQVKIRTTNQVLTDPVDFKIRVLTYTP